MEAEKMSEIALQDSEAWFRIVVDNTPIGMVTVSIDGKFMR
jgi:PAS domain-containing protein